MGEIGSSRFRLGIVSTVEESSLRSVWELWWLQVCQEWMVDTLQCCSALVRVESKHRDQPGRELLGGLRIPFVLVCENLEERPRLQFRYISQLSVLPEELLTVLAAGGDMTRDGSSEFNDVR